MRNIFDRFHIALAATCLAAGAATLIPSQVVAEAYRSVDENGNVVYSDRPTPGAERIPTPSAQTVPMPTPVPMAGTSQAGKTKAASAYLTFAVIQPAPEKTVRDNNGNVDVSLLIEPSLDRDKQHQIRIYLDRRIWGEPMTDNEVTLTDIDRGAHQVAAIIVDADGKTVAETAPITFYLHRGSVLAPGRARAP
ncbi:MAG: DUF4124 domain-containing protein [Gammaproteobacteria bacterium]|nr:DUF4124 domain-containing protein [Gammaproteobacteria bacterium]